MEKLALLVVDILTTMAVGLSQNPDGDVDGLRRTPKPLASTLDRCAVSLIICNGQSSAPGSCSEKTIMINLGRTTTAMAILLALGTAVPVSAQQSGAAPPEP